MQTGTSWTKKRLVNARTNHPAITDAVVTCLEKRLESDLQKSSLSNADRSSLASDLLKDMRPPKPKEEDTG